MSQRDDTHDDERPLVIKAIDAALVFCAAWTLWKSGHDVDSLELNCCDSSKVLHKTANEFEAAMRKLVMNKNFINNVFGTEIAEMINKQGQKIMEEQEMALARLSKKH
jgi:hypothetical protein